MNAIVEASVFENAPTFALHDHLKKLREDI